MLTDGGALVGTVLAHPQDGTCSTGKHPRQRGIWTYHEELDGVHLDPPGTPPLAAEFGGALSESAVILGSFQDSSARMTPAADDTLSGEPTADSAAVVGPLIWQDAKSAPQWWDE